MKSDTKTVYLVDGSSYIHRAYHAIRSLANSKGLPTNAVYGFTRMLMKLLDEKSPDYIAVVLDAKGPTFRHHLFKEYKATRPPMPEDMAVQIPYIKRVLSGFDIPMLEKEGYEADDIIATIAVLANKQGLNVVIVSGDKDFRQSLSHHTVMWDPMNDKLLDYNTLKRDYGLEPEQVIEVMALSGDSADNVPGIPGVGEKTALTLIQQFHSIENLFQNIDKINKTSLKNRLHEFKDQASLSKRLVSLDNHVPIEVALDHLRRSLPKNEELAELFRELDFKTLLQRFTDHAELGEKDYRLISTVEGLKAVIEAIQQKGAVCFDTETTSRDPLDAELVGISFCLEPGTAFYLPLGHTYPGVPKQLDLNQALELLGGIFRDAGIKKIGQNIKYDAEVLSRYGIKVEGLFFDTMVASYVIDPTLRQHNLDYLAQHYLSYRMVSYDEVTGHDKAKSFAAVDIDRAREYSCEDAEITLRLQSILEQRLKETDNYPLFQDLEMKLIPVLIAMEETGVKIDVEFFKAMSDRFARELSSIEQRVFELTGEQFNINSPQQLGSILFEKLKLPVKKKTRKKSEYSTDFEVLTELAALHEVPSLLLRFRTISKLKSTYLDALVHLVHPATGRVHTSYNQTVAATGRLSSSNPNLQNIPVRTEEGREIRRGFIAEKDHLLVSADYSQIELRVFAHYSDDPVLLDAFTRGEDVHTRTAAEIFNLDPKMVTSDMRRMAKTINFGIIYGMGPVRLAKELGISKKTAQAYLDSYYERYKGVKGLKEKIIAQAQHNGYVTTLFNRTRNLPHIHSDNGNLKSEAERTAINTPIQGTAADLIKMAMIRIAETLGTERMNTKMLLQVHDELVFEVPQEEVERAAAIIKDEMEGVYPLKIPLRVDINWGSNWDEAH
jgi:DNA polymerase-1